MKNYLAGITALLLTIECASASEVDYASIEALQIEAQTTVNTFGRVVLSAKVSSGMGTIADAKTHRISVNYDGIDHIIPNEILESINSINFATLTISAEYGYPERGLGPSLYISFQGQKNGTDYDFVAEFGKDGFLKLNENASNKAAEGMAPR